ncbi:MAG: hypothetical protein M1828_000255 [Chrysothrix sp. TS-e1954]|nr:MAG: hypothetical protein M1828_000255 [Chrysothrix sp. TS-e1954]
MASNGIHEEPAESEDAHNMLEADDADEELEAEDEDAHMDSDPGADDEDEQEEIQLQNDSIAHFDGHKDSIFCIARHPKQTRIVATGGGDDTGYVFDASSGVSVPPQESQRASIRPLAKLEGHNESVNALTFTLPDGAYLVSADLQGQMRAYRDQSPDHSGKSWQFLASTQEVEEINFLTPCPHPLYPNTIALGAKDGSVWVYTIDGNDTSNSLQIVQAFYLHTAPCTAGAWTPDGKLLCTVSEDGSFYAWDVFGDAAAAGLASPQGGQNYVVGLTADDERFRVEGGLYSVKVSPGGAFAAMGGAEGNLRVVGLPRLGSVAATNAASTASSKSGAGARAKPGGGKQASGPKAATADVSTGQAGQILASLQTQSDSVETIAFSQPPLTFMAVGSVDGSIVLFDARHQFAVRRHITDAHDGEAVIQVDFVNGTGDENWMLTSCGNDGTVRRWDTRGGAGGVVPNANTQGALREWQGHRGGGEGGGVLGFVQDGDRIVTAGDDRVSLIFGP